MLTSAVLTARRVSRPSVFLPAIALAAALAHAAGAISAQTPSPSGIVAVRLQTALGDIDLAIDTARAPITAANFLRYVDGGFYDGGRFHRATRPDTYRPVLPNRPPMEIVQAGPNPEKRPGFPPIPLERTSVTGITHVSGVISMARGGADSATSDFFIMIDDQPSLDFGGKRFDDAQGAAAFGHVTAGMDVVRRIQQQPVAARQPTADNPLALTQNLAPPVTIIRACRLPATSTGASTKPGC